MALRAGFIGLGTIGKPMAKRLVPGGLATTVFDIVPAAVDGLVAAHPVRREARHLEVGAVSNPVRSRAS